MPNSVEASFVDGEKVSKRTLACGPERSCLGSSNPRLAGDNQNSVREKCPKPEVVNSRCEAFRCGMSRVSSNG
ncbi:hypothetical protein ZHAS_00013115 [Anopheles sinensis]|uniref:Uncharacterized protein n=1 Tax=Anopheles sinensis TaxID=74873 RepID=A0A084W4L5_ANOSI|nr:hypothetical protein ZHAS_00013115 [Anopheles sinensis]